MARVRIDPSQLGSALRMHGAAVDTCMKLGAHRGAMRGWPHLVTEINNRDKVDRGQFKNSWSVNTLPDGSTVLRNSAPHAGIIEGGARPHPVNAEGIAALTAWARRKLGVTLEEAEGIAAAIAWKLRRHGQKPTWIVRRNIPALSKMAAAEIIRLLRQLSNSPPRGRR
jgi:hypothetical protein